MTADIIAIPTEFNAAIVEKKSQNELQDMIINLQNHAKDLREMMAETWINYNRLADYLEDTLQAIARLQGDKEGAQITWVK